MPHGNLALGSLMTVGGKSDDSVEAEAYVSQFLCSQSRYLASKQVIVIVPYGRSRLVLNKR